MRFLLAVAFSASLLLSGGCGDSGPDRPTDTTPAASREAAPPPADVPVQADPGDWGGLKRLAGPRSDKLLIPRGPSPERVVIRDVKRGTGPPIERGDLFRAQYASFAYETGKVLEPYWRNDPGGTLTWGTDDLVDGWEPGLRGMRAGGIRELIVPSSLAYGDGPRVYLVRLLTIEPKG